MVGIRLDGATLAAFDLTTRQLLRTNPHPFTYEQAQTLRGARFAGPPPRPDTEAVTVQ